MFNRGNLAVADVVDKDCVSSNVLFYDGGTVATNGHILVKVSRPDGDVDEAPMIAGEKPNNDFGEFTLDVESIKKIKKGLPQKSRTLTILENAFVIGKGDTRRLVATDLASVVSAGAKDGGGPPNRARDVDHWQPKTDPAVTIKMNAESLIRILKVMKEAQGDKQAYPVTFKIWSDCDAVRMDAENIMTGQKIEGLIMPMKL